MKFREYPNEKNSYDGKEVYQFMGKHEGNLSEKVLGNDSAKKWSDLWYIFKPLGYEKTLAEMTDEERENRTRYESVNAMTEFAKWYKKVRIKKRRIYVEKRDLYDKNRKFTGETIFKGKAIPDDRYI